MQDKERAANASRAEAIKQATFSLIVERGFGNVTTAMIADKAEASKGLIHYYFGSKEKLVIEVMKSLRESYLTAVKEVMSQYPENEERLEKGIRDFWEAFKADPSLMIAIFEITINGRNSKELRERVVEFHRGVVDELKKSMLAGWGAVDSEAEKEAEAILTIVLGVLESMCLHYILDPQSTDFEYALVLLKNTFRNIVRERSGFSLMKIPTE
jgi:AcrR family transcriptional regulator